MSPERPKGMAAFTIIWSGQLVSMLGSAMTGFALSIWAWEQTGQAIWQLKVPPNKQGRVFAARRLIAQASMAVSMVLAGPLADNYFEPAMAEGGSLTGTFGGLVGTGPGAGMALMIFFCGVASTLAVLLFYTMPSVRNVEALVPDHDAEAAGAEGDAA